MSPFRLPRDSVESNNGLESLRGPDTHRTPKHTASAAHNFNLERKKPFPGGALTNKAVGKKKKKSPRCITYYTTEQSHGMWLHHLSDSELRTAQEEVLLEHCHWTQGGRLTLSLQVLYGRSGGPESRSHSLYPLYESCWSICHESSLVCPRVCPGNAEYSSRRDKTERRNLWRGKDYKWNYGWKCNVSQHMKTIL